MINLLGLGFRFSYIIPPCNYRIFSISEEVNEMKGIFLIIIQSFSKKMLFDYNTFDFLIFFLGSLFKSIFQNHIIPSL